MRPRRLFSLIAALAFMPGVQAGTAPGGDWVAYRDAYRAMVVFEKYGGPKSLLQQHLQVLPRTAGVDATGAQLLILGKTSQGNFPLDPTLRTLFPLMRAAFDENAALQLNRPLGPFSVRPQVTIALRPDNLYDSEDLRQGCEQALAFARQMTVFGASRCVGVRFVFSKGSPAAPVVLRAGIETRLTAAPGAPFSGDGDATFPVVTYRFGGPQRVQLGTISAPLAITPLFAN
ncbi:MAG: hypothetical protein M3Y65_09650 [Pseudomonadota bacterium]|nr:hypothetical protein [Pseudomonadota bacterium]